MLYIKYVYIFLFLTLININFCLSQRTTENNVLLRECLTKNRNNIFDKIQNEKELYTQCTSICPKDQQIDTCTTDCVGTNNNNLYSLKQQYCTEITSCYKQIDETGIEDCDKVKLPQTRDIPV